ncbi:MAG: amidohydrolase, partial [Candidatus Cloacimonetes bacterium]|nr:amidohydrolase [Candidatus Cloacimonadota bacterium]
MTYIIYGGYIYGQPNIEAVLIVENRIVHVGKLFECRNLARTESIEIHLHGRCLLPAFTDAHTHFVEYAKSR